MNGDSQPQDSSDKSSEPAPGEPVMARAEEKVDQLGERVGQLASEVGQRLRKAVARAREEGEDMWAEAQHIRNGGKGESNKPDS
ncbi:MAG: hypothetical protein JWO42_330 [Chloroflexi bacterium]|nr:hypothetical protein [Chloroflexota bacterium]